MKDTIKLRIIDNPDTPRPDLFEKRITPDSALNFLFTDVFAQCGALIPHLCINYGGNLPHPKIQLGFEYQAQLNHTNVFRRVIMFGKREDFEEILYWYQRYVQYFSKEFVLADDFKEQEEGMAFLKNAKISTGDFENYQKFVNSCQIDRQEFDPHYHCAYEHDEMKALCQGLSFREKTLMSYITGVYFLPDMQERLEGFAKLSYYQMVIVFFSHITYGIEDTFALMGALDMIFANPGKLNALRNWLSEYFASWIHFKNDDFKNNILHIAQM